MFPNEVFSCTNHVDFLEAIPNTTVIRLKSDDARFIYEEFVKHLAQRTEFPHPMQGRTSHQN